jgi:hypothetical protein
MPTQKQVTSFRMNQKARSLLEQLAAHHGVTRAALVEMVIREAARRDLADDGRDGAPPPPKKGRRDEKASLLGPPHPGLGSGCDGRPLPRKGRAVNTPTAIFVLGGHQRRILLHLLRVARLQEAHRKRRPSPSEIRWSAGNIYPELREVTRSLSAALSRSARRLEESGLIRPAVCTSLGEAGPSIAKYCLTAEGRHLAESVEEIGGGRRK